MLSVNYRGVECSSIESGELDVDGGSSNGGQENMSGESAEESYSQLKNTLDLYLKYQQLLDENMFHSSAQKKMVLNKFKDLKQTLANYLEENSINNDMVEKLNAELNKNRKHDKLSVDMEGRVPFKWG